MEYFVILTFFFHYFVRPLSFLLLRPDFLHYSLQILSGSFSLRALSTNSLHLILCYLLLLHSAGATTDPLVCYPPPSLGRIFGSLSSSFSLLSNMSDMYQVHDIVTPFSVRQWHFQTFIFIFSSIFPLFFAPFVQERWTRH